MVLNSSEQMEHESASCMLSCMADKMETVRRGSKRFEEVRGGRG